MPIRPSPFVAAFLLLALSSQVVIAQQGQGPKVSPRDEYRACLDEQDALQPQQAGMQVRLDEHIQDMKRLQDELNAQVALQGSIDEANPAAVSAFNARLEVLNRRVDALNARGDGLNKEMSAYNAKVADVNRRCAGMVVSLRDRDAVAKERAAQGKK